MLVKANSFWFLGGTYATGTENVNFSEKNKRAWHFILHKHDFLTTQAECECRQWDTKAFASLPSSMNFKQVQMLKIFCFTPGHLFYHVALRSVVWIVKTWKWIDHECVNKFQGDHCPGTQWSVKSLERQSWFSQSQRVLGQCWQIKSFSGYRKIVKIWGSVGANFKKSEPHTDSFGGFYRLEAYRDFL